jgi:hypothetical protein
MLNDASAAMINPVFLRHDLMVEADRLEMALEDARERKSANDQVLLESLQTKHARIVAALSRLPQDR